jgi:hypothetical protein
MPGWVCILCPASKKSRIGPQIVEVNNLHVKNVFPQPSTILRLVDLFPQVVWNTFEVSEKAGRGSLEISYNSIKSE